MERDIKRFIYYLDSLKFDWVDATQESYGIEVTMVQAPQHYIYFNLIIKYSHNVSNIFFYIFVKKHLEKKNVKF